MDNVGGTKLPFVPDLLSRNPGKTEGEKASLRLKEAECRSVLKTA